MEINNINVIGAGSSQVSGLYSIVDPTNIGIFRQWRTADEQFQIEFVMDNGNSNIGHWSIIKTMATGSREIYYQLTPAEGKNTVDPWSNNGTWTNVIGGLPAPSVTAIKNSAIITFDGGTTSDTDEYGTVTTTKTTIVSDTASGNKSTETNVTITKQGYNYNEIERIVTPKLMIGGTYRFRFKKPFDVLGYVPERDDKPLDIDTDENSLSTNGIYKITEIKTWLELITEGKDVYSSLYLRAGVPRSLYESDAKYFANTIFYTLVDPNNEGGSLNEADNINVVYMPLMFIDGEPDPSVDEYSRMVLMIDMGFFSDTLDVGELSDIITDILQVKYGIKKDDTSGEIPDEELENANKHVSVGTVGSRWFTEEIYTLMKDLRERRTDTVWAETCYDNLLTRLFNTEKNRLYAQNKRLIEQNTCYENIIRNGKQIGDENTGGTE